MDIDWLSLAESPAAKPGFYAIAGWLVFYAFWIKAEWVGEHLTGHFVSRFAISSPTPAWMLRPFGLLGLLGALIATWDLTRAFF